LVANKVDYAGVLAQVLKIKNIVNKTMHDAGIDRICINRTLNNIEVEVYVARPGVAIGRGGEGIQIAPEGYI
jgi:small subunit ribosomal protein S3